MMPAQKKYPSKWCAGRSGTTSTSGARARLQRPVAVGSIVTCGERTRFPRLPTAGATTAAAAIITAATTIAAAAGEDLCLAPVRDRVARSIWPHQAPGMKIVPAALGEELAYYAGVGVALGAGEEGA